MFYYVLFPWLSARPHAFVRCIQCESSRFSSTVCKWSVFYLCLLCACVMLTPLPVAISVWEPEQPRQDVEHRPINKSHLQWVTLHAASGERDTEHIGGGEREWRRVGEEKEARQSSSYMMGNAWCLWRLQNLHCARWKKPPLYQDLTASAWSLFLRWEWENLPGWMRFAKSPS